MVLLCLLSLFSCLSSFAFDPVLQRNTGILTVTYAGSYAYLWVIGADGLVTPLPFRVDYPEDPETIGLQLSFLEVSVTGEIQEVGKLVMRLEEGKMGSVLSVMREPAAEAPRVGRLVKG